MLGGLSIDPEGQQWYNAYNESRELEIIKKLSEKEWEIDMPTANQKKSPQDAFVS